MYEIGDVVKVNNKMQAGYSYIIEATTGEDFAEGFNPYYTPQEMLEMGVFEGKYCNDCQHEYPKEWFSKARISSVANPKLNYFGIKSRQSLFIWQKNEWIIQPDPRGWFEWYCRYYLGRRIDDVDAIQIKRWRNFARHAGQIKANCKSGDLTCRPKQRQALLQWSHNAFI